MDLFDLFQSSKYSKLDITKAKKLLDQDSYSTFKQSQLAITSQGISAEKVYYSEPACTTARSSAYFLQERNLKLHSKTCASIGLKLLRIDWPISRCTTYLNPALVLSPVKLTVIVLMLFFKVNLPADKYSIVRINGNLPFGMFGSAGESTFRLLSAKQESASKMPCYFSLILSLYSNFIQ